MKRTFEITDRISGETIALVHNQASAKNAIDTFLKHMPEENRNLIAADEHTPKGRTMNYPTYSATTEYSEFVGELTKAASEFYAFQIEEAEVTDHLNIEDCGDLDGILIKEEAEHHAEELSHLIADDGASLATIFLNDAFLNTDDKTRTKMLEEREQNIYTMDIETQTETAAMVLARVIADAFANEAMRRGYGIDNLAYMNE